MSSNEFLKQIKKMQSQVAAKQSELDKKEFIVEKQGIKVTIFGNSKIKSIEVDEMLVDPEDKELLEDLIVIAINEALELVESESNKLMPQMPGGLPF